MTVVQHIDPYRQGFINKKALATIVLIILGFVYLWIGFKKSQLASRKKLSARVAIASLRQACEDYYEDNSQLPGNAGEQFDKTVLSNNDLMALLSYDGILPKESPHQIVYFKYRDASGTVGDAYDGLDMRGDEIHLYGPWKNENRNDRYYRLVMDYNFDEQINEPATLGGEKHYGMRVLIYHLDKDGEAGPGKNEDNIYSYK